MRQSAVFFLLFVATSTAFPVLPRHGSLQSPLKASSLDDSCDIAIFGGGFGGLYTALAISSISRQQGKTLDVALVEPSESFVFLPLLYDLTVGTATEAEVCPSYRDLLEGTGVRQVKATLEDFENPQSALLLPTSPQSPEKLSFRGSVISVGASPDSILARVPGASEFAQPFYTEADAKSTRRLLARLEDRVKAGEKPRVGIVGGGFGGIELAASVKRKIPAADVTLLCRGPPMAGTRAEPLVDKALAKLGVLVEQCSVDAIEKATPSNNPQGQRVLVKRTNWNSIEKDAILDEEPWDAVLWTAGSAPANPVTTGLSTLRKSEAGRLAIDSSLRCFFCEDALVEASGVHRPPVWALGDCAEIVAGYTGPAVPKTAQAAMQQADVVAFNLLSQLESGKSGAPTKKFEYQDLGSMLTLGGPNAALMAPKEGAFAPIFSPLLDTVGSALGFADKVVEATVGRSTAIEKLGLDPETLGLSLGSYGIGVESGSAPGTLAGTLTGAARRAVYAARMPTNRQRAVAVTSAALSTAAALAKEAAARNQEKV